MTARAKRRGRPPSFDRPMSAAERKRRWQARQRERVKQRLGFDPLTVNATDVLLARSIPALVQDALVQKAEPVELPSAEDAARWLGKLDDE
jgi:hypothetical protein